MVFADGGSGRCPARLMCPVRLITTAQLIRSKAFTGCMPAARVQPAMGWYQRGGPAPGPEALGCDSSWYKIFGMGASCGVRSWCCTEDAHLFGIHIILLARCQLLLSISVWVWLSRPPFPRSIPRTDARSSNIFTLACLLAINY